MRYEENLLHEQVCALPLTRYFTNQIYATPEILYQV